MLTAMAASLLLAACGGAEHDRVASTETRGEAGDVVAEVLREQPWLAPAADGQPHPTFTPRSRQDAYDVVASVSGKLFGERHAGARLSDRAMVVVIVDASEEDRERLVAELRSVDELRDAAAEVEMVSVDHSRAELERAQQEALDALPADLRERVGVSVDGTEGRVVIYVESSEAAERVQNAIGDVPTFVVIEVDPDEAVVEPAVDDHG